MRYHALCYADEVAYVSRVVLLVLVCILCTTFIR